jgi:multisubunit Na+/H+ antiporter MnhB subunit
MVDLPDKRGMSPIVKTVVGWVKGIVFVFAIYILAYGHLTPGGGFAGGVILALGYVMMTLCCGKENALRKMPLGVAAELDSVGALMFLVLAWIGMFGVLGSSFFGNYIAKYNPGQPFHLFSAGFIPICNIAIAIKVAASLFLVYMILVTTQVLGGSDR